MSPVYKDGVEVQPTATPTIVMGTAGSQGSANTVVASDATILAFDATNPSTQASADSPVVGVAAVAARRDHKHGMPTIVSTFAGLSDVKIVRKTADETVNDSAVLQNDDELLFAVAANEVWAFELFINYLSGTTPDLQVAFAVPTAAAIRAFSLHRNGGVADINVALASGSAIGSIYDGNGVTDGTSNLFARIIGVVINGANAGNLQFQWAQYTQNASNTTVKANSFIIAHRLA